MSIYTMNLLFLFCAVLTFVVTNCLEGSDINVAVVEYHRNFSKTRNEEKYLQIIKSIPEGTDFIIFPESSLTEDNYTVVPALNIIPKCVNVTLNDTLTKLACAAQSKKAYISVNIDEKVKCDQKDTSCGSRGFLAYNTNVVFGKNGSIIARYRKWNLFGEADKNITKTPDIITIKTDKGDFGIFTCFDILFQTPALNLTRKGVKNFIFPSMWFSEMPFLTSLQTQHMWSYETDALLLSSGANNIVMGSGGSGVFLGKYGAMDQGIPTNIKEEEYVVISAKVPSNRTSFKVKEDTVNATDDIARGLEKFLLKRDNLTGYTSELLNMTSGRTIQTLCNGDNPPLCCNFDIRITVNKTDKIKDSYLYRMVAFSGQKKFVYDFGGVEVCGIVPCTNKSLDSCTELFPSYDNITWPTTFENIQITANFTNNEKIKMQFPNSLLSSLKAIPTSQTLWKKTVYGDHVERKFKLMKPQTRLLTFAIYGRDTSRDTLPNSHWPNKGFRVGFNKVYFVIVAISLVMLGL